MFIQKTDKPFNQGMITIGQLYDAQFRSVNPNLE